MAFAKSAIQLNLGSTSMNKVKVSDHLQLCQGGRLFFEGPKYKVLLFH